MGPRSQDDALCFVRFLFIIGKEARMGAGRERDKDFILKDNKLCLIKLTRCNSLSIEFAQRIPFKLCIFQSWGFGVDVETL